MKTYRETKDSINEMAKTIWDMRHTDSYYGISNAFLSQFHKAYLQQTISLVMEWFNTVWDKQINDEESYGDYDYKMKRLFSGNIQEPDSSFVFNNQTRILKGETKHIKVLYVENVFSDGKYLFLFETKNSLDSDSGKELLATIEESKKAEFKLGYDTHSITIISLNKETEISKYKKVDWNIHKMPYSNQSNLVLEAKSETKFYGGRYEVDRIGKDTFFEFDRMTFALGAAAKRILKPEE